MQTPQAPRIFCFGDLSRVGLWAGLLCLAGYCVGRADSQSAHLSGHELIYDAKTQRWEAQGGARLDTQLFVLESERLTYSEGEESLEAQKNVVLSLHNYHLVAEYLQVSLKTKAITGQTLLLSQPPFFLYAKGIGGTLDALELSDVALFMDEPGGLRPWVHMRQVVVTPTPIARIQASGNKLYMGSVPIFFVPEFSSSLKTFPFVFQSHAEYTRKLGMGLKTSLLLPLMSHDSAKVQAGPVVDVYSRRGVLVGPKAQYHVNEDTHAGSLEGGYLQDHCDDRGEDFYGKPIPKKRGFLYWKHQSHPHERFSLTGRVTALSDAEIERDTRYVLFNEDPLGGSYLEGNYRGEAYQLSVFMNKRLNSFQNEVERLPELRLDWMPRRWGASPFYGNGFLTASHVVARRTHDDDFFQKAPELQRLEAAYGVECPLGLGPLGVLTPRLGTRLSHYPQNHWIQKDVQRAVGELVLAWEGCAYSQWEAHSRLWRVEGLRHRIRPSLEYHNLYAIKELDSELPAIEKTVFNPNVPTLDLMRRKDAESLGPRSILRIGLENTLQTRDPDYGSRDLVGLRLYHDRPLEHPQGDEVPRTHPSYGLLSLTPLPFLGMDVFTRWHTRRLEEVHTRLKLFNQQTWSISLGAHHLKGRIEQYATTFDYRFSQHYRAQTEVCFDAHTHRFLHHGYRIFARMSQSWDVGLSLDFYPSAQDRCERIRLSFKLCMLSF